MAGACERAHGQWRRRGLDYLPLALFSPETTSLLPDLRTMAHDRVVRKDRAKKLGHCTEGEDHLTGAKMKSKCV